MRAVRITVQQGRLRCLVAMDPHDPRETDAELAAKAQAAYPTIAAHSCVNEVGERFGDVIAATSVPHLLEHLVIEEQLRDGSCNDARCDSAPMAPDLELVGYTQWVDEERGLALIEVSFTDDLVALRAFRDALAFLNDAMVG